MLAYPGDLYFSIIFFSSQASIEVFLLAYVNIALRSDQI